jgi:hypothetical protein
MDEAQCQETKTMNKHAEIHLCTLGGFCKQRLFDSTTLIYKQNRTSSRSPHISTSTTTSNPPNSFLKSWIRRHSLETKAAPFAAVQDANALSVAAW